MIPIISFVGKSGSGKTTYLEKLIPLLTARGYRIGVIKHDAHGRIDFDRPGKDTYRHFRSGAAAVVISGPGILAMQCREEGEAQLDEIAFHLMPRVDLIMTEGYRSLNKPKIEIFRREISEEPLCGEGELLALVSDDEGVCRAPRFPLDNPAPLADFLEQRFLKRDHYRRVSVLVDGKPLPCKDFVQDFIAGGILGMVASLHGAGEPHHVSIEIRPVD